MVSEQSKLVERPAIDAQRYRKVLGSYPTGVSVVTGVDASGQVAAMVVGTFTAVSIDPPLVGFLPDRNSSSWAKLQQSSHFCISVLSDAQEDLCRQLSSKNPDKFAGVANRISPSGAPILDEAVAWIECAHHSTTPAGDHDFVLGLVLDMDASEDSAPLLFHRGSFGGFAAAPKG